LRNEWTFNDPKKESWALKLGFLFLVFLKGYHFAIFVSTIPFIIVFPHYYELRKARFTFALLIARLSQPNFGFLRIPCNEWQTFKV
jgi:hypothetical protein